jgi:hypothetical protein
MVEMEKEMRMREMGGEVRNNSHRNIVSRQLLIVTTALGTRFNSWRIERTARCPGRQASSVRTRHDDMKHISMDRRGVKIDLYITAMGGLHLGLEGNSLCCISRDLSSEPVMKVLLMHGICQTNDNVRISNADFQFDVAYLPAVPHSPASTYIHCAWHWH